MLSQKDCLNEEPVGIKSESGEIKQTQRRLLYCKQCGYVVLRGVPPYKCPICGAKRELFGEIVLEDLKVRDLF